MTETRNEHIKPTEQNKKNHKGVSVLSAIKTLVFHLYS